MYIWSIEYCNYSATIEHIHASWCVFMEKVCLVGVFSKGVKIKVCKNKMCFRAQLDVFSHTNCTPWCVIMHTLMCTKTHLLYPFCQCVCERIFKVDIV